MSKLNQVARQTRIAAHKQVVLTKLSHRVIDVSKPAFSALYADGLPTKKMDSLNGAIILERDLYPDGKLRGVVSIDADDLAAILPDLKVDTQDKAGWKKHLDKFAVEGVDLLAGIPLPGPNDYDPTAEEELLVLDVALLTDADAKGKLTALQAKLKVEKGL